MSKLIIPKREIFIPDTRIIPEQKIVWPWEVYPLMEEVQQPNYLDVYLAAWEVAAALAYDPEAYADWGDYKYKYRNRIHSLADAVKYANEALKTRGDKYARLLSPAQAKKMFDEQEGSLIGIGVVFENKTDEDGNVIIGRVLENGPAHNAGIRRGDALKKVGRFLVKNMDRAKMIERITGEEGTKVKLTVVRDGQELEFECVRGIVHIPAVRPERVGPNGEYLFTPIASFSRVDLAEKMKQVMEENDDAEGIIVGLRFNPGGLVQQCIALASLFIEEGVIVKINQRIPYKGHQETVYRLTKDKLIIERTVAGVTYAQQMPREPYLAGGKPVVVLIDKWSASASEMFSGALKDNGVATIVGNTSFGKGIGQSVQPLLEETVLIVTSLKYFTPSDHWIGNGDDELYGVEPHIQVDLPEGVMPGEPQDAQLNRAIEVLNEKLAS